MRRYLFLIMAFFLLCLISCSQKTITGADFYQVKGKVRLITENSYRAINVSGVWLRNPQDSFYFPIQILFDEEGNILKETKYSSLDKDFKDATLYEYKNNVISRIMYYDEGRLIRIEDVLKAQANCGIIKTAATNVPRYNGIDSAVFKNDTTTIECEWKDNRIVKVINSNGSISLVTYDEKGNCTKQIQIRKNNKTPKITIFEYLAFDNNGNWTKRIMYDKDNPNDYPYIEERKLVYY